ncbi:MAG: hypothetical protein R3272_10925 [Candidatus Promineifilaceae bacterium]|nr:hypothetical protein [Candidatus Promineifilaceae bacterium]
MKIKKIVVSILVLLLLIGCRPEPAPDETGPTIAVQTVTPDAQAVPDAEEVAEEEEDGVEGYPAPEITQPQGYPADAGGLPTPEGLLPSPPDPEREPLQAEGEQATIGGVLVREVGDDGYLPLVPRALILAELLTSEAGTARYLRQNESSPRAELFDTGVFLFRNVSPGTYGLIVDLGFAQYIVEDENGEALTFTVGPGEALDLGQVFVQVPTEQ